MASQTCMICGVSTPIPGEFQITKARETYPDPDETELKIHIRRKHSLEEMQKYIDPAEVKRKAANRKAIESGEAMEQETEANPYTEDVVSALFEKARGGKKPKAARKQVKKKSTSAEEEEESSPAVEEEANVEGNE